MRLRWKRRERQRILKGMAAGAIGGLAGAFVMNQSGQLVSGLIKNHHEENPATAGQQGRAQNPETNGQPQESEDATQKAAEQVAVTVLHRRLNKKEKQIGGPVVHYLFGAAVGAAYGAAAEKVPINKAAGLPLGAAVWAMADELAVPALGLARSFKDYPPSVHVNALATHLVYGVTTELVRRGVRNMM